ncbi:glycerophosphodiester phosphodiesterase [uncultured Methylibium sp.]|uniref:glycerophosphodiester phosphodiesterase n=1 Tax=uncultured Methylibium sp. TaxID=381093 RepID=UPI0025D2D0E2|nr:glycerophosphodiester phosphodiesterase [uncultured Methylibium sp.]
MTAAAPWPYPFWIAHRGAGKLAPENTLAAFGLGLSHGYRMAECDVTLSADGVAYLLHDERLERTTDGRGVAVEQSWDALSRLDAGAWHGARHAGEPLPSLATLAGFAQARGLALNLEIKPGPGDDARCGRIAAAETARLWAGRSPLPLMSSFSRVALQAARDAAPGLPRAHLFEWLPADACEQALDLGCVAIVAHFSGLDAAAISLAHAAGLRVLSYTVNDAAVAERLRAAGIDGLITDAIDRFDPATG